MTIHQYNTLRWIDHSDGITINELRACHMGNIGSLAKRHWIQQEYKKIYVTVKGYETMEKYKRRLTRKHEDDLTKNVMRLLHLGRLIYMKRVA